MVSFVKNWFGRGVSPVGVDLGGSTLRLAQVETVDNEFHLTAAASAPIPDEIGRDPVALADFYSQTLRRLWDEGRFRGRRAVFCFPTDQTHIQHLRLPRMETPLVDKAIPWEVRGKLPFDPAGAVIRHVVAGDVYCDNHICSEIIVMAVEQAGVDRIMSAARKARIDVAGIHVQPRAILDCFLNVYRRKSDAAIVNAFVDIGRDAARVVVTRGADIRFARQFSTGAAAIETDRDSWLARVISELTQCRHYHDSAFPQQPIDRLIFVGGKANDSELCLQIARQVSLEAIIGDPLLRLARTMELGAQSVIDRRQPQPSWAVAIGLSMGTPRAAVQRKAA